MACFRGKALILFDLDSAFPQSSRSHLLAVLSRVAPGSHKYIGQLNSESALSVFALARDAKSAVNAAGVQAGNVQGAMLFALHLRPPPRYLDTVVAR